MIPPTVTPNGLHEFVVAQLLSRYGRQGVRATDLGTGPGAMAARLSALGCDVLAVDRDSAGFEAKGPHITLDFDQPDSASPSHMGPTERRGRPKRPLLESLQEK